MPQWANVCANVRFPPSRKATPRGTFRPIGDIQLVRVLAQMYARFAGSGRVKQALVRLIDPALGTRCSATCIYAVAALRAISSLTHDTRWRARHVRRQEGLTTSSHSRNFLNIAAVGGGALIAAAGGRSASAAPKKFSQKQARYQTVPKSGQRCQLCALWQAPTACKVVEGEVSPAGWCILYQPKS